MQTPTDLNEQHAWGGNPFPAGPEGPQTGIHEQDPPDPPRTNHDARFQPFSQTGFIASNSDDLFHPAPGGSFSRTYNLPNVPYNPHPRYHINHRRVNSFSPRSIHYPSSYNNPSFVIPPATFNRRNPTPVPPVQPRTRSRPESAHTQPFPPAYIQPHLPTPQPASTLPSPAVPSQTLSVLSKKPLPSVAHITILSSKLDFSAWEEGVSSLIRAIGLIGHILDPSEPIDPTRPDLRAKPVPVLPVSPTLADLTALNLWWDEDNVVQHILVSRLGSVPRSIIPSPNIVTRTAFSIYKMMLQYYGTSSYADCTELLNSLHNATCTNGRVQEYVTKWRNGISRLQSAKYSFNVKTCITLFVRGLPLIAAFTSLRADLPDRIDVMPDQDLGAFMTLMERVLTLDTIFRSASQAQAPRIHRPTVVSVPSTQPTPITMTAPLPAAAPDPSLRVFKSEKNCGNCKSRGLRAVGHIDATCFQPGGGMEGRRDEYMSNKGRVHAMFAECLESAFLNLDSELPIVPSSPSPSPTPDLLLDDDLLLPPIANLCVTSESLPTNSDVRFDLYFRSDSKPSYPLAYTLADFQSTALLSMVSLFNTLLDSGCTHHIVRDRALFRNYVAKKISVGTANCGSLAALGYGDVEFRYPYRDRHVLFTLRGCLYAPNAPINLLSVGALVERGMSCHFSPGGVTKVFYPNDHPLLPGFIFLATVTNRLSFFNLTFIPPVISSVPTAFPALATAPLSSPLPSDSSVVAPPAVSFPRLKLDSMLWHRRFGHIGMDATRVALTKNYVTGVRLDGPFIRDYCISCIVGKSPQKSYPLRSNRAATIGELLHMDLCGPFPVGAPRGEKYFFNILDDRSNWGFTFGLRLKSDAFSSYRTTEAFLERSCAVTVLNVRCGGELELTAGQMGEHFTSKGIVVQRTVPYAHQQNGKSERYIRTIEEGGQALLADAGLPMSFWLDAVLTRQYLVNRLPTSTLPADTTPFELIHNGRKPDLSHLRVWGCDCYVAVPDEIRPKAGSKRYRAIFVGYEEHRIGWRVRDLSGKYSFSNDIIFNENLSGRLGIPRPPSSTPINSDVPSFSRPIRDKSRVRTSAGQAYDDVLRLKEFRRVERERKHAGVDVESTGDVFSAVGVYGGASDAVDDGVSESVPQTPFMAVVEAFFSLIASSSFSVPEDTFSLGIVEYDVLWQHVLSVLPSDFTSCTALRAVGPSSFHGSRSFDLSKAPLSYSEAVARPDASVWQAAMDRERLSLQDMGAFEETDLPPGEKAIGLKWVFAHKTDEFGVHIKGKEKARLVAQGFNQRPGQFDETYAPVAKMASIRILLTWAAVHDLEIFQFDCKTAFLHAKLRHTLYARPFPGFPITGSSKVLRILVALYGLRQSAYEFYMLIMSLILELGMVRCEVDHGVFIGEWSSPPDPSAWLSPILLFFMLGF